MKNAGSVKNEIYKIVSEFDFPGVMVFFFLAREEFFFFKVIPNIFFISRFQKQGGAPFFWDLACFKKLLSVTMYNSMT